MTLSYEQLKKKKQLTREEFQSRFSNTTYKLYDFLFIPDEMNKEVKRWEIRLEFTEFYIY